MTSRMLGNKHSHMLSMYVKCWKLSGKQFDHMHQINTSDQVIGLLGIASKLSHTNSSMYVLVILIAVSSTTVKNKTLHV